MSFSLVKNFGTLHNIAKGLVPLLAAICLYLPLAIPLFAANPSAICRYLPLAIPSFAANFNELPLFAANNDNEKLPQRVI